jgi:transcriptional regulator with XRE-family HTH domain
MRRTWLIAIVAIRLRLKGLPVSRSPSPPNSIRRFYKRPPLPTDAISRAVTSRLLRLHEASGLSEYQAAKKACLSHNTIFKLRTHSSIPSIDTMLRLAAVYGVDPAALISPVNTSDASNKPGFGTDPTPNNLSSEGAVMPGISQVPAMDAGAENRLEANLPDRARAAKNKEPLTA